jgi:hypothetical protein
MALLTVEVKIDHGALTVKEAYLLPEQGTGLLTITHAHSDSEPALPKKRVQLPLVHCVPGTNVNPSPEELDASAWD